MKNGDKEMNYGQVRTDLALEAKESLGENEEQLRGVSVKEYDRKNVGLHITKVQIESKNAQQRLRKPMGIYVTMETDALTEADEDYHRDISENIAKEIYDLLPKKGEEQSVLVVGLGNRFVTADALGPLVVDNLFINRHIIKEYGKCAYDCKKMNAISCIEPGVMAKTGMEALEIVRGVIKETQPDCVLVVDALAARSIKRLNRTIQISNAGIQPGSGVGNHRNELSKESLGVPVIAIGVPTVVDAATIVGDALGNILGNYKEFEKIKCLEEYRNSYHELNNMYMTGKDVDAIIKRVSYTISEGINMALAMGMN